MSHYCAWGDTRITCSSEEEGYENHASGSREKRNHVSGISGETFAPVLLILDDSDQQFWAEDELSNSESRQKLIARRKRRHSASYRNRTAKTRSRSQASSSDSTYAETSPNKIRRIRRYCRCRLKPETEKLRCLRIGQGSRTSIEEEMPPATNKISSECQVLPSTSGQQFTNSHRENDRAVSSRASRQEERASDTMRHV